MIVELDRLALIAWHHAVWFGATGELVDVSAHPLTGFKEGVTLFAVDPRQRYPLEWPLAMPLMFYPLTTARSVQRFAAAEAALHRARKWYFDLQIAVPSATYSSARETISTPLWRDGEKLRALELKWEPRIAAAAKERDACLLELEQLQAQLI